MRACDAHPRDRTEALGGRPGRRSARSASAGSAPSSSAGPARRGSPSPSRRRARRIPSSIARLQAAGPDATAGSRPRAPRGAFASPPCSTSAKRVDHEPVDPGRQSRRRRRPSGTESCAPRPGARRARRRRGRTGGRRTRARADPSSGSARRRGGCTRATRPRRGSAARSQMSGRSCAVAIQHSPVRCTRSAATVVLRVTSAVGLMRRRRVPRQLLATFGRASMRSRPSGASPRICVPALARRAVTAPEPAPSIERIAVRRVLSRRARDPDAARRSVTPPAVRWRQARASPSDEPIELAAECGRRPSADRPAGDVRALARRAPVYGERAATEPRLGARTAVRRRARVPGDRGRRRLRHGVASASMRSVLPAAVPWPGRICELVRSRP